MFPPAKPSNHGIRPRLAGANRGEFAQVYIYSPPAPSSLSSASRRARDQPGKPPASFSALGKCCEPVFKRSRLFETSPLEPGAHLSIRGRRKRSRAFSSDKSRHTGCDEPSMHAESGLTSTHNWVRGGSSGVPLNRRVNTAIENRLAAILVSERSLASARQRSSIRPPRALMEISHSAARFFSEFS